MLLQACSGDTYRNSVASALVSERRTVGFQLPYLRFEYALVLVPMLPAQTIQEG